MELEGVLDFQQFFEPLLPPSVNVSHMSIPHQFHIRQDLKAHGTVKSAVYCRLWSDTEESPACHLLQSLPTAAPVYKAGRQLFFGKDSQTTEECDKRYDAFEAHVNEVAEKFKFSVELKTEWAKTFEWLKRLQFSSSKPFEGFWPLDSGDVESHLRNVQAEPLQLAPRPEGLQEPIPEDLLHTATQAAALSTELEQHDFQGLILSGNNAESDLLILNRFDAKRGNFVILDASGGIEEGTPSEDLIGDWEREVCVGFVRERIYAPNVTPAQRRSTKTEPESLDIQLCEPWAVHHSTGKPVCPLWIYRQIAGAKGKQVDTSWEAVKRLPWLEVQALPIPTFQAFYAKDFTNKSRLTRDFNFMNSGLAAVVRLDLQDANLRQKTAIQRHPFGTLHYTCQLDSKLERRQGVKLPEDALLRAEKSMKRARLMRRLHESSELDTRSCQESNLD